MARISKYFQLSIIIGSYLCIPSQGFSSSLNNCNTSTSVFQKLAYIWTVKKIGVDSTVYCGKDDSASKNQALDTLYTQEKTLLTDKKYRTHLIENRVTLSDRSFALPSSPLVVESYTTTAPERVRKSSVGITGYTVITAD
jgi:hypothetical protein